MRNFTTEDFTGCGQYLVRGNINFEKQLDAGFLSSIMYKVGYCIGQGIDEKYVHNYNNVYTLISMSDGLVYLGYFTKEKEWLPFNTLQVFVDYLNNPELSQEYRFATQEEIVRVVMYQKSRWK